MIARSDSQTKLHPLDASTPALHISCAISISPEGSPDSVLLSRLSHARKDMLKKFLTRQRSALAYALRHRPAKSAATAVA
jgi:hypothetical protein